MTRSARSSVWRAIPWTVCTRGADDNLAAAPSRQTWHARKQAEANTFSPNSGALCPAQCPHTFRAFNGTRSKISSRTTADNASRFSTYAVLSRLAHQHESGPHVPVMRMNGVRLPSISGKARSEPAAIPGHPNRFAAVRKYRRGRSVTRDASSFAVRRRPTLPPTFLARRSD